MFLFWQTFPLLNYSAGPSKWQRWWYYDITLFLHVTSQPVAIMSDKIEKIKRDKPASSM